MDRQKGILGKGPAREVQGKGKAHVETSPRAGSGSDGKGKWEDIFLDKFGSGWSGTSEIKQNDSEILEASGKEVDKSPEQQLFIERKLHPNDTLMKEEKEQFLENAKKDKDLSESVLELTNKAKGIIEGVERIPISFLLTTIVHDTKAKKIIDSYNRNIRSYNNEKRAGFFRAG